MAAYKSVPVSSEFTYPLDQRVVYVDCEEAFAGLSKREKLYAHFLSQASLEGGLIIPFQTSREAPMILLFFVELFEEGRSIDSVKDIGRNAGLSEDDIRAIFAYAAAFFSNGGNYKGWGDTKFVPLLPRQSFDLFVNGLNDGKVSEIWSTIANDVYNLNERTLHLGLMPSGVSTYFSANCTKEDGDLVMRFLDSQGISPYNTRVIKVTDSEFQVRVASVVKVSHTPQIIEFESRFFTLTGSDYALFLERTTRNLEEAIKYAANDNQRKMLENYALSFRTGSVDAHKDGSRFWIKDKSPSVESYIGFIETYKDPTGIRGEFEGFVAIVNRELSKKFQSLVQNAEKILPLLPWKAAFEKDTFLNPDFTSLDLLSFATSGVPSGINIPNYDEIRQTEGFKNVVLGNVIEARRKSRNIPFLCPEDVRILTVFGIPAFELQTALHELLGHGCGKLFYENKDGTFNFPKDSVINPLTGEGVEHWYREGETYDVKFGAMSSAYEECRAEACALHLGLFDEVLEAFGLTEASHASDVQYAAWLDLLLEGLENLSMYQPADGTWGQAHARAYYALLQVVLESGVATIQETVSSKDGKPDLLFSISRDLMKAVGGPAVAKFLQKLQVYKATGDVEGARAVFEHYSHVNETFTRWREIILSRREEEKFVVMANTHQKDDTVELKRYPASVEGLIQSSLDRYGPIFKETGFQEKFCSIWNQDEKYFRLV